MKVVKRAEKDLFMFVCKECGSILLAKGNEFEFVKKGHLRCTCASCKADIIVKERQIYNIADYEEIEPNINSEKVKA